MSAFRNFREWLRKLLDRMFRRYRWLKWLRTEYCIRTANKTRKDYLGMYHTKYN